MTKFIIQTRSADIAGRQFVKVKTPIWVTDSLKSLTWNSYSGLVDIYGKNHIHVQPFSHMRNCTFTQVSDEGVLSSVDFLSYMDAGDNAEWEKEKECIIKASAGDPDVSAYIWDIVQAVKRTECDDPDIYISEMGEGMHPEVQHAFAVYLAEILKAIPCTVVCNTICTDTLNAFIVIAATNTLSPEDISIELYTKDDVIHICIGKHGKLYGDGDIDGLCINRCEKDLDEMLGLS